MTWFPFSSVPGLSVPGLASPGLAGTASTLTTWVYIGHVPGFYLDYIDAQTRETLSVVPDGSYAMFPVNSRAGLTVPPPDHCWLTPDNQWGDRAVFRPDALAAARAHNAALQASSRRGPAPQSHGSPRFAPRVPAPPSKAAMELAAARRVNAERQAAVRRESVGR